MRSMIALFPPFVFLSMKETYAKPYGADQALLNLLSVCSVHPDGTKTCFVPSRDHGRRVKSVANREEMCKDAYSRAAGF